MVNKVIDSTEKEYYRQLELKENGKSDFMYSKDFQIEQNLLAYYFIDLDENIMDNIFEMLSIKDNENMEFDLQNIV